MLFYINKRILDKKCIQLNTFNYLHIKTIAIAFRKAGSYRYLAFRLYTEPISVVTVGLNISVNLFKCRIFLVMN